MINPNSTRVTLWKPAGARRSADAASQELPVPVPGPNTRPVNFFKITPRRVLIGGSIMLGIAGLHLYTRPPSYLHKPSTPVPLPEVPQAVVTEAYALATPTPQLAEVPQAVVTEAYALATPTPQLAVADARNDTFRVLPFPAVPPAP